MYSIILKRWAIIAFIIAIATTSYLFFHRKNIYPPILLDENDNGGSYKIRVGEPIIVEMVFLGGNNYRGSAYNPKVIKMKQDFKCPPREVVGACPTIFKFTPLRAGYSDIYIDSSSAGWEFKIRVVVDK